MIHVNKERKNNFLSILHFIYIPVILLILLFITIYYTYLSFLTEFVDVTIQAKDNTFISSGLYSEDFSVSEEFQFDGFIWMVADGVSWEFTEDLRNNFKNHSKIFKQQNNMCFYSSEIAKTYMTGRLNEKFSAFKAKGDNLIRTLLRKGKRKSLVVEGCAAAFFQAVPTKELEEFTAKQLTFSEAYYKNAICYPFYFKDNDTLKKYLDRLEEYYNNNYSVFSWSETSDEVQHKETSRKSTFPESRRMAKKYAEDILVMKEWIDKHPNYLLVLSADHGHAEACLLA